MKLFRVIVALGLLALSVGSLQANEATSAPAAAQHFEVPAGPAERTLVVFSHQSAQPTLFPTALIQGIETRAISGDFTAAEALHLMLAGTGLEPVLDPATGTLAVRPGAKRAARVIELPPYVVEERGERQPVWRYASVDGLEVISRCSDEVTRQWIDRQYRLHALLGLIFPREFQAKSDVPMNYVLFGGDLAPEAIQEMVAAIRAQESKDPGSGKKSHSAADDVIEALPNSVGTPVGAGGSIRFLPNFRFWDQDSRAIFFVMNEASYDPVAITLTPGYVRSLLEARSPLLPAWFREGFRTWYETIRLPVAPVVSPLARPTMSDSAYRLKYRPDAFDVVTVKPFVWGSPEETEKMIRAYGAQAEQGHAGLPEGFPFLPLKTLFQGEPPAGDAALRTLWRHESALFINWALNPSRHLLPAADGSDPVDDPKFNGPQALWKFLAQAGAGPVTEPMFKACFGFGYEEAEGRLLRYLPLAAMTRTLPDGRQGGYQLAPVAPLASPTFDLRDATAVEVARIKGRLDRLEVGYMRELYASYPDLIAKYAAQAQRTLRRVYEKGERDPLLLAELGLYECENGRDVVAQPLLEVAAAAKVVRPRVYYELARIRYATIRAQTPEGKLTVAEAGEVLQPLATALRLAPALPGTYELMAEVWLRSAGRLNAAQLALLDSGIRLFPHSVRLVSSAAILQSLHGRRERAEELAEQGLRVAATPADRDRFLRLRTALAADAAKSPE